MAGKRIRLLMIEDSEMDAELILHELRRSDLDPTTAMVHSAGSLEAALEEDWNVVVCDQSLPGFSGSEALSIVMERRPEVPFIIVSGTVGEEAVVKALKAGARDCVMKTNLRRLGPVVHRELEEAEGRRRRQEAEEALAAANEARRQLLARLVTAQEEERLRIAQDIHDDSIQVMTALALQLDRGAATTTDPESQALFADAADIGRTALERLRRLTFDLHPPTLDEFGLRTAIEQHLATAARGLQTTVTDTSEVEPDPQIRTVAYRVVQEAIQNVCKHADASRIEVIMSRVDDRLRIAVTDDGRGFDVGGASRGRPGHLGLVSMRERAEMAGGSLSIRSRPGAGTTIELLVPLSAAD